MKEQNDIDKIFESKLNNSAFELKEAYLADFESKLDVYNKKRNTFFWFIFSSLIAFTILYDFIILPSQIVNSSYKITEVQDIENHLNCINESIHPSINITLPNTVNNSKRNNQSNFTSSANNENKTTVTFTKEPITNSKSTKTKINPAKTQKAKQEIKQTGALKTKPDLIKTEIEKINNKSGQDSLLNKQSFNYDKLDSPDVYLDDTIRRQVFIIDTIVKIDTIVINDTIKNKIRLFKKKN